jgi:hypothetical protein
VPKQSSISHYGRNQKWNDHPLLQLDARPV